MKKSSDVFKKSFDDSVSKLKTITPEIFTSINQMKGDMKEEEKLKGGLADKKTLRDVAKKHTPIKGSSQSRELKVDSTEKKLKVQLKKGKKVETEHTKNKVSAKEIAMDHLWEDPKYYSKLQKIESGKKENKEATGTGSSGAYSAPLFSGEEPKKVEAKEATGSGSVGAYETPAAWAKSTKSKDWRGKSKTQIPGGSFVSVKKKCKSFPYCNQGDISALNIYERAEVKNAIDNVSKKLNISESVIKAIIQYELEKNGNY